MGDSGSPEELAAIVEEIRERVRSRYPDAASGVRLPDLLPLLHARDAAQSKVASIGAVNPRPGGPVNALVQAGKRWISRALDWHVREQVNFNRHAIEAIDATLEALNEANRTMAALAARIDEVRAEFPERDLAIGEVRADAARIAGRIEEASSAVHDLGTHWAQWREGWEHKLFVNENQFLRGLADIQGAFQHRVTLMESNLRQAMAEQHANYQGALDRSGAELQTRFWEEVRKARLEMETLIHEELRIVRQRVGRGGGAAMEAPAYDAESFAERFRGSEEYVSRNFSFYVPVFRERRRVLDIGCGRGEFLKLMAEAGVAAEGIDSSTESVAHCRAAGLQVEQADLFAYLGSLAPGAYDGMFCAQVVEHLPPARIPEFIRLAAAVLPRGGVLAIETPNPACLAIFATHFYLDPTHQRPVPAPLLAFYLTEAGFGDLRTEFLAPAEESMPSLKELPESFRREFFGGLDYAIIGTRLG
ncbi:MAG: class I SAM-dependent methyltransferase [Bryobacterales bacterium]|nr:class I SAM-dependent methyltransferase [Bryobacterales bacterium]